jgi:beta-glucosidase
MIAAFMALLYTTAGRRASGCPRPGPYASRMTGPNPAVPRRGISLGGALDGDGLDAAEWVRDAHLDAIAAAGFETLRLPVKWSAHQATQPPYEVAPTTLSRVERLVDAALGRGLAVVLDVHHFDPLGVRANTGDEARFLALWDALARRFAGTRPELWFELLNEPHGCMTAPRWNRLLAGALAVVRATGPERGVIAGPVRWNTVDALDGLALPADERLAATVHYYSPFRFTHQGAGWIDGAEGWRGTTWGTAADRARVRADLERAADWAAARGVPLLLGEFGVTAAAPMPARAAWTALVRAEAERLGIAWCYWDFATDFGAYDLARGTWHQPLRAALLDGGGPSGRLPPDFRFGASTSAYQIEGATADDGRGRSIWDVFCRVPGAVARGETGDVACDHYHRFGEDVDLMASLGLETYRFSIAWSRVQPEGRGALNAAGVAFYRALAEALLEHGIEPVATLYHSDLPQALQDAGGWAVRDTAARFADYAGATAAALGDVIAGWITHNEPWGVAFHGHADGSKAPGLRHWPTAVRVAHHLLVSHGLAIRALRAARADAAIGISLNLAPVRPASSSNEDRAAARRRDGHLNRWFLDALLRGAYPEDMLALYAQRVGPFAPEPGDLETIVEPLDFLGVNYYHPEFVRFDPAGGPLRAAPAAPPPPVNAAGWHVDPGALREVLGRLCTEYAAPPVWITENGVPDEPGPSSAVEDAGRVAYLRSHLDALDAALAAGADVRRYFHWSLLDNFEWELGYAVRFGLIRVEPGTLHRVPKRSALWYRDHIARVRARR